MVWTGRRVVAVGLPSISTVFLGVGAGWTRSGRGQILRLSSTPTCCQLRPVGGGSPDRDGRRAGGELGALRGSLRGRGVGRSTQPRQCDRLPTLHLVRGTSPVEGLYRMGSSHLGFVRAAPTLTGTSRIRLPPASADCCVDSPQAQVSHPHSNSSASRRTKPALTAFAITFECRIHPAG